MRSARSLARTESSETSLTFCPRAVIYDTVANAASRNSVSKSNRCRRTVFDNFITRYNLSGATHGRGDAAILLIGEFDRSGDCLFRNATASDDMLHVQLRVSPRELFTPITMYFDAVISNVLPLLLQHRNDVDAGAATEREQ